VFNSESGSGFGSNPDQIKSKFVILSEKALAIEYLKRKNLDGVQGKQDDQVFVIRKIINNIVRNVLLVEKYNQGHGKFKPIEDRSYSNLNEIRSRQKIANKKHRNVGNVNNNRTSELTQLTQLTNCKNEYLKHKQIKLKLKKEGVHPNPGPKGVNSDTNLSFMTYNCRGLRDIAKLRRLLAKLNRLVNQNFIIALQETHKIDNTQLDKFWKHNYLLNCTKTNKGGVALLFGNDYKVNELFKDDEDRFVLAEIASDKHKIIIGNVYYPNDHKEAKTFSEKVYSKILEFQYRAVDSYTCIMGDMNHCVSGEDSVNRRDSLIEKELAKLTKSNNELCGLVDSYRVVEKIGGYTWTRGDCFSRLDYIFVSGELKTKINKVGIDWCLDKSDHAAVVCNLRILNNIEKGPGIVKLNVTLLEKEITKKEIRSQLIELLKQIPEEWNPHTKLEYTKMSIRTVFSNVGGIFNKERNTAIKEVEDQINRNNHIREKEMLKVEEERNKNLLEKISETNTELNVELEKLRLKYSEDLAFKSGVRWYEEGEKSNKYFLGLMKKKSSQKVINEISNNGEIHHKQEGIMKCIKDFYEGLYKDRGTLRKEDKEFFKLCPKLTQEGREDLDRVIRADELGRTLRTCKESAPGPDGITYNIYKELWQLVGPIIADSWNFGVETGIMSSSHLESTLTLLPKEGKDTREIKNWRPITLSNCDAKIITKTLANRFSKHLESIIDPSQTAYVPGRSVMDNMRSNLLIKNYCKKNKVEGVIVALDAKKAFDSHEYIRIHPRGPGCLWGR
jgi:exonuclease III